MAIFSNTPSDNMANALRSNVTDSFPPAQGQRVLTEANTALPGNDKGNPVSTGRGGIKASLRIKNAGSHDAPGTEKTVNIF